MSTATDTLDRRITCDTVLAGECRVGEVVWSWDEGGLTVDETAYPPRAIGSVQLSSSTRIASHSTDWSPPTREAWLHLRVVLGDGASVRHDLSARVPPDAALSLAGIPALDVDGAEVSLAELLALVGALHALKETRPQLDTELHPEPDLSPSPREPVHIDSPLSTRWAGLVAAWLTTTVTAWFIWPENLTPDGWTLLVFAVAAVIFGVLTGRMLRAKRRITYDRAHHERTAPYVGFLPRLARFRPSVHDESALRSDADFLFRSHHDRLAIVASILGGALCYALVPWAAAQLTVPDDAEVVDGWLGVMPLAPLYAPLMPYDDDAFQLGWTSDGAHLVVEADGTRTGYDSQHRTIDASAYGDPWNEAAPTSSPCTADIPVCAERYRGKVVSMGTRRVVHFSDSGSVIDENGDASPIIEFGPGRLVAIGRTVLAIYFEQSHRLRLVRFRAPDGAWLTEPWMRDEMASVQTQVRLSDDERVAWAYSRHSSGELYATEPAHAEWSARPWRRPSAAAAMHPSGHRFAVLLESGVIYEMPIERP